MTTEERKLQYGTGLDPTGIQQGAQQAQQAIGGIDKAAQAAAAGSSAAADKMAQSWDASSRRQRQGTARMIEELKRLAIEAEHGGKRTAAYYEQIASSRGYDTSKLQPYLDKLREIERAQAAAAQTGVASAGQTRAAWSTLPAQLQDLAIQIQGGQSPFTALAQQGSQIVGSFGGVRAAAAALGPAILGLINPATVAAAAVAALGIAYYQGAEESARWQRQMILSGQVAGTTAGQLQDAARTVAAQSGATQGRASEVAAAMAQQIGIGAESVRRFTLAALEMERAGGPAAEKTAEAFAKLADSPSKAAAELNRTTGFLTASLYSQIRALEDVGRTTDAARLAQEAYSGALERRTPEMVGQLGLIERGWQGVRDTMAGVWDRVKDIGRVSTTAQQLAEVSARIAASEKTAATQRGAGLASLAGLHESELTQLRQKQAILQETLRLERRQAEESAAEAARVQARAKWADTATGYLSKQAAQEREIARARAEGAAAGVTQAEVEQRVAAIREKYAEKAPKVKAADPFTGEREAAREWAAAYLSFSSAADQAEGKVGALTATQIKLAAYLETPGYQQMSEPARQLALAQAYAAITAEQQADAMRLTAEQERERVRVRDRLLDSYIKGAEQAATELQRMDDEARAQGMVADGTYTLAQAIQAVTVARLREQMAINGPMLPEQLAALQREIDLREQLITSIGIRDAAQKERQAWADAAKDINASLTSAFSDAFDSGGLNAEKLRKAIEREFKQLVITPTISAALQPLTTSLTSALTGGQGTAGLTQQTSALSQIMGWGSTASGASSSASALSSWLGLGGSSSAVAGTGLRAAGSTYGTLGASSSYGTIGGSSAGLGGGAAGTAGIGAAGVATIAVAAALQASSAYDQGFRAAQARQVSSSALGGLMGPGTYLMGGLQADLSNGLEKIGLSSKMANILSGASLFASVFGRAAPVVTDQGVTGTLSGAGFEGTAYADVLEKGGWLRSDKRYTLTSEADSEIAQLLTDSAASVLDQTEAYAAALGLGTSTLADVSTSIRVSLGTDTEANKTALLNAMTGYADDLAAGYSDTLAQLATYGESASDTLTRVGESLTSVNDILQTLGQQALAASVDGAANAIALQDAFGGADAYTTAAGTYLQAFYSDIERAALLRAQVAEELQAVGITTLPASKAAYRELVDAQDLTTESGRTAYATLLTLSSAFDTLSQSVETATSALADEIARLRGETTSSTGASLVALQAQFATSTAAARAGDATALAGLPELSQAIDEAAAASASSALDLQRMRAWLASSLEGTTAAVGSYTADTALTSAADTAAATASSAALAADQLAELQALREQTAQLVSAQATSAAQLTALTRLIDRLSEGGDALRTTTA